MTARYLVAAAVATTIGLPTGVLAQTRGARDFDVEYRTAVAAAKEAAGFEWLGTLVRTCLLPQSGGENTSDNVPDFVTDPAKAPPRDAWYAEPAKVFDDVYFVGGKIHSSWALTTRDGIILIDTLFPYNSEQLIVGGMQKLGLDPKQIKYLIISHAHTDHIGGAEIIQKKYGARVVMGAPDWEAVEKYPNRFKTMAPERDIVATDGMKITLGGRTVTIWLTPGHTPGTLSYVFPVKDQGRTVMVAYSGGTLTGAFGNDGARWDEYIASQRRIAKVAAEVEASVMLSNHSEYDGAYTKARLISAPRQPGESHPFIVGTDAVQRYFTVMAECATASKLRAGAK